MLVGLRGSLVSVLFRNKRHIRVTTISGRTSFITSFTPGLTWSSHQKWAGHGAFDGSQLTTDGGGLLLRQADRKIGLLQRVTACFTDHRRLERVEHELHQMLAQRIYGLALGYEDLNDHEQLREDPLLALLAGQREITEPLAGKSTLNRMELTPAGSALASSAATTSCARGCGRPTRTQRGQPRGSRTDRRAD